MIVRKSDVFNRYIILSLLRIFSTSLPLQRIQHDRSVIKFAKTSVDIIHRWVIESEPTKPTEPSMTNCDVCFGSLDSGRSPSIGHTWYANDSKVCGTQTASIHRNVILYETSAPTQQTPGLSLFIWSEYEALLFGDDAGHMTTPNVDGYLKTVIRRNRLTFCYIYHSGEVHRAYNLSDAYCVQWTWKMDGFVTCIEYMRCPSPRCQIYIHSHHWCLAGQSPWIRREQNLIHYELCVIWALYAGPGRGLRLSESICSYSWTEKLLCQHTDLWEKIKKLQSHVIFWKYTK